MSYVDLHLHLLPGVDDGPRNEHDSIRHAARMAAEGVREATVTPHVGHPTFEVDPASIPARTRDLQAVLEQAGIRLRLHPGGEIHANALGSLSAEELDTIAHGPPGARWVLAEAPFGGIDDAFLDGLAAIRRRGFGAVIAHPERSAGFLEDGLARLEGEIAAGSVLQVNVCSLQGRNGREALVGAERLVRERLAYVLASDGHGGTRGHTLRLGRDLAIAAGASPAQARQLTEANPRFLLRQGLPALPATPAIGPARTRAWHGGHARSVTAARDAAQRLGGAARG